MAKLSVEIIGTTAGLSAAFAKASAEVEGFSGRMSTIGSKMTSVGKTLTTHLTLPIVAVGAVATKSAVDFQNSMELIHTQAGKSQAAVDSFSKSVLALAGPTATAPDTLSQGLFHLASQGLKGKNALDALRISAEGARMGQANLEDVTNALGAVIASKISGVHSYGQAMGELNATVGAGDMRMQDLADAMGTGLPAKAKVAGVSLRDVSAALAVFGDNNIRGANAGTLLNSTLRIMAAPSKAAAKALASVGLTSTQLGDDLRKKGLVAAMTDLKTHLEDAGLTATQQAAVLTAAFGGRQSGGVQILIDQLTRLKTKVKEVGDGGNRFASDWKDYTKTTAFHMNQMGASMQAAGISIGTMLLPAVSKIVNVLAGLASWFQRLSTPVKDVILVVAGLAAVIGPLVGIIGAFATAIGGVSVAMTFLAANPVVAVITAIALLAIGLVAAYKSSQTFRDIVKGALSDVGTAVGAVVTAAGSVSAAFQAVKDWFSKNWPEVATLISGPFAPLVALATNGFGIRDKLIHAFKTVVDELKKSWGAISSGFKTVLDKIGGWFSRIGDIIAKPFQALISAATSGFGLVGAFQDAWNAIKAHAGPAFRAIAGTIVAVLKAPINAIIELIDAIQLPSGIHIKTWHGIPDGFSIDWTHPFHIPKLAEGGIVTAPTIAMIGERGPEAIVPLGQGGGFGGPQIIVNMTVHGSADADFATRVSRELAVQLKGGRTPQLQQAIAGLI